MEAVTEYDLMASAILSELMRRNPGYIIPSNQMEDEKPNYILILDDYQKIRHRLKEEDKKLQPRPPKVRNLL
ncbi:hypothetical protein HQ587_04280 [bacterium]|nr:hypothetical protein [bacterium]